ncbi:MAG: muramoyltetrapeptide carboxypeptidase [Candidatus Micrarchaeota archaeon]|nr:MAG: muramoyltetrapeptide carboxypeptidase [Candidatus Micrarchaeota archaeon]
MQSLLQQEAEGIKALVIGRFQNASGITDEVLKKIINNKRELANIPVIANVDFGHTTPQITFPIGVTVKVISEDNPQIEIRIH